MEILQAVMDSGILGTVWKLTDNYWVGVEQCLWFYHYPSLVRRNSVSIVMFIEILGKKLFAGQQHFSVLKYVLNGAKLRQHSLL